MNGHLHPLTQMLRASLKYFESIGYVIAEGPEIETEWNNFDALNISADHPSRDVQDTFWLKDKKVLRTHTTATDPRVVKEQNLKPPFKLIIPGRCFRNEATDATHNYNFYHIDGIAVAEDISMADLIGTLKGYMEELFGKDIVSRVRPAHFSFVEPGLELDIKLPNGKWREMLGAGMGHPKVLQNMGIDPERWQAIMWGMGIDRYMLKMFKLDDIRNVYNGDLRVLKQF
jgi:phenylalanyl-tRNA synthetase alpha chain